jgi:hypothetical protein
MSDTPTTRAARIEANGVAYRALRAEQVRELMKLMPPLSRKEADKVDWLYAPKKQRRARRNLRRAS